MRVFPIMVFDSGIGGLSTLCALKKALPNENFVYVADFLHSPYGNKTKKTICKIVTKTLQKYVFEYRPKCIVIACNTATAVCIENLRKVIEKTPIFGCEPAIKMAQRAGKKKILVLCTKATKKHSHFLHGFNGVTFNSPKRLAGLVDKYFFNKQKILKYIKKILKKFAQKFDAVVLGCTHYCLFKKEIENVLKCPSFEGNSSIAKHIKNFLINQAKTHKGKTHLISTKAKKQHFLQACYKEIKGEKICVE